MEDSESFKSRVKKGKTPDDGNTKDVEIIMPFKYLSNFWITREMLLINCEVNLILTCSSTSVITNSTGAARFSITDAKLYVPVVALPKQHNAKFLTQLKSGFKRAINWNKYYSNPKSYVQNRYLNHLLDLSFQGVNRVFLPTFENEDGRTSHSNYYLPKVTIKDYNVMIDGKNVFDQPITNKFKIYENIAKIKTGKVDNYTTGCSLVYEKQQALDFDPRAIQQINFTANLERAGNTTIFFIIEEAKGTVLEFSEGNVNVL